MANFIFGVRFLCLTCLISSVNKTIVTQPKTPEVMQTFFASSGKKGGCHSYNFKSKQQQQQLRGEIMPYSNDFTRVRDSWNFMDFFPHVICISCSHEMKWRSFFVCFFVQCAYWLLSFIRSLLVHSSSA